MENKKIEKKLDKKVIFGALAAAVIVLAAVVILMFLNPEGITLDPSECTFHSDGNDDGKCDKCSKNVLVAIDFYAINDLHGKFDDNMSQPGVDELTKYFKLKEMIGQNMVLLSSGDMWQGSSESNMTKGAIITDWMSELGFVSMTLGNHEFDWGEKAIEANAKLANFPFLAINIYSRDTNKPVSYCKPSVVVEREGVKIGIIGAIGDCYSSISGDFTKDIYFKTGAELTTLVKNEAERLRKEENCDLVVYSIHDGYDQSKDGNSVITDRNLAGYYDISLSKYVDLVFEAHTHKYYVALDSKGVYHLQDGGENYGISHATATVNIANGKKKVTEAEFIPSYEYSKESSDPLRDNLLNKYAEQIAEATKVLGTIPYQMGTNEILPTVAKLYYEKGVEKWGDKYDIVLGGGYLSLRSPYTLKKGEVIYSDLQAILPFDNELVLCSIKGMDLQRVFIESQNEKYYMYYGEYGQGVKKYLELEKTYYVIVDSYTSTYAPNNLTEIERLGEDIYARDLFAEYIKAGKFK